MRPIAIFIAAVASSSALQTATAASPAAAAPIEVEAPGPTGALRGTLLAPEGARAVVVMIPGSGPTDRDGNSPAGVRGSVYRLLAEGLAARGIATIRTDKRGLFGSAAAAADANRVEMTDYAADVRQWVRVARERTGASCAWVLGHSEGGLVALLAGQQPEHICGLILVSATGRPVGTVIREQLRSNPANAPLLDEAMAALDSLEAGRRYDTTGMNPALMPLFAPPVQDYFIRLMAYDPAALMRTVRVPVLIVQGQRDIQVRELDARTLAEANPATRLVLVANANHALKSIAAGVASDHAAQFANYGDASLPLAPGIVEPIAEFVSASTAAGRSAE
jgi:pimeloyl-ACP methyl ester carboxylesterase